LQLSRSERHHPLLWDEPTAIHLGEDAGEAEFLPQPAETIGDHLRHADDGLAAQHLVIANGLEPLTALDPPCGVGADVAPIDASPVPAGGGRSRRVPLFRV